MYWLETYYEIVDCIGKAMMDENWSFDMCQDLKDFEYCGRPALYEIAIGWTDEFERIYEGREWDGDWLDTLWQFMDKKLKG